MIHCCFLFLCLVLIAYFWYRYLLRRSALELFMVDRSNFFFDYGVFLKMSKSEIHKHAPTHHSHGLYSHAKSICFLFVLPSLFVSEYGRPKKRIPSYCSSTSSSFEQYISGNSGTYDSFLVFSERLVGDVLMVVALCVYPCSMITVRLMFNNLLVG